MNERTRRVRVCLGTCRRPSRRERKQQKRERRGGSLAEFGPGLDESVVSLHCGRNDKLLEKNS